MFTRIFGATLAITAILLTLIISKSYPIFENDVPGAAPMPVTALAFIILSSAGMVLADTARIVLPLGQILWRSSRALGLLAPGAVYAVAMPMVGFVPATGAFILLTCLAFGGRSPVFLILLTVCNRAIGTVCLISA